jgi:hypothetical protein
MITRWLKLEGSWRSITASERIPWEDVSRRRLRNHQVCRWWQNELTLTAAPCFRLHAGDSRRSRTLFTLFSIVDRMHRPQ